MEGEILFFIVLPDSASLSFHEEFLDLFWIRGDATLGSLAEDFIKVGDAGLSSCVFIVLALSVDLA
jgi:hypothetical protein